VVKTGKQTQNGSVCVSHETTYQSIFEAMVTASSVTKAQMKHATNSK